MRTHPGGQEGKRGEWVCGRLSGAGVVRGVADSRGVGFPDFRQQCLDLIGGEAAVGEFFQTMGEVESDIDAGSLGAGEHGPDGGDGRAALLGAERHPVLAAESNRTHAVLAAIVGPFEPPGSPDTELPWGPLGAPGQTFVPGSRPG